MGHTGSLDCVPLYWGLARTTALLDVDLVADTPDRLARRLLSGDLDIAAVPAVTYLRHSRTLLALPGIAAGSDGPMMSAVLVCDVGPDELHELHGRTVALTRTGPTSSRLARLLLEQRYGVAARYVPGSSSPPSVRHGADAEVLFGNTALDAVVARQRKADGPRIHDLAGLWRDWTGLPFVFAVWAVRREYARHRPDAVEAAHRGLLAARDLARTENAELAARTARWEPFEERTLAHYFGHTLDYSFGPRQMAGLAEFARRTGHPVPSDVERATSVKPEGEGSH
ncbi:menaquinone biosynthetic enzyme MqnA/MqnD family protein [Streptomyces alanosinicus]|uniref:menaquinone biosynthetic enzyme MqnA/MqnD family protein n=1 Tax=Streptomyces alanosinicus TaxID=68171 RepID=UPI001E47EAD1|nr:menaquinone biosynthesis protein [Streptomyces alanosinicus]